MSFRPSGRQWWDYLDTIWKALETAAGIGSFRAARAGDQLRPRGEYARGTARAGHRDSYTLGELIIDALVNALDYTDASDRSTASLNAHKRAIVELLVAYDRPYETGHVRTMRQQFQAAQALVAPAQAVWDSARIDLDLATVKFTAVRMTTIGYSAEAAAGAAGPARDKLAGLGPGISADVNEAVQVGARYAAPGAPALSPAQIQTRRDNFTDALLGLGRLRNAVAGLYADQTPAYDGFLASLAPFAT